MANSQQIETSINPSPNPPPPGSPPPAAAVVSRPSDDETNRSATAKRSREEYAPAATDEAGLSGDDVPPLKKRVKVSQDVVYRIVVPSRQIGKVIGKAGHRIQKIREETKATIKVADAIARHEERVIIISSKDNDDMFSDAENALHQIVSLILKDDGNLDAQKVGAGHVAANTVRFLIAGSQAGGLIGMSGQNIETLRNSSGATITVLAQHQLPLCASAHESDRVVQLAGDIPAVLRAVVEIGCQLRDNPPKQVISISPTYNLGYSRPPQPHVDPSSAEYVNLTMLVPESLAGGLIGRCGSNISRIRAESGATIKVHGGKGEQKQRQVHLGGSAQQVALAKQRVDEYVYSQLMLQAGGEQLQDTMQLQQQSMQLQQSMHLQHSMQMQQQIPNTSATLMPGYNHGHGVYMNSNPSYTPAIDMWAVGAVLAELFTLCPIFPGESEIDQLYKICCVLGPPDWTSFPELRSASRLFDINCFDITPANLSDFIPNASLEAIDLIKQLCSWDPLRRPTADQCLQHPFFHVDMSIPRPLEDPLQMNLSSVGPEPNLELNLWDFGTEKDDCYLGLTLAVNPTPSCLDLFPAKMASKSQGAGTDMFCSGFQDHSQHSVFWSLFPTDRHQISTPVDSSLSLSFSTIPQSTIGAPQSTSFGMTSLQSNFLERPFLAMSSSFQQGRCL